jgi:(p)ppGpp synthase/HD superfamily hydrolase
MENNAEYLKACKNADDKRNAELEQIAKVEKAKYEKRQASKALEKKESINKAKQEKRFNLENEYKELLKKAHSIQNYANSCNLSDNSERYARIDEIHERMDEISNKLGYVPK